MKLSKNYVTIIVVCVIIVTMLGSATVFAPPPSEPPTQPGLYDLTQSTLGNLTEISYKLDLTLEQLTEQENKLEVKTIVDNYRARPTNNNFAHVLVQVTSNGEGVADLEFENFEVVLLRGPIGFDTIELADVQPFPVTPGNYILYLQPELGGTWSAGLYVWTLRVTNGTKIGNTLFSMTVVSMVQDTWINEMYKEIKDTQGQIDESTTAIGERLNEIEENFDDQMDTIEETIGFIPAIFNISETIDNPFGEHLDWPLYRMWVNSTESFQVKAFYLSVYYGDWGQNPWQEELQIEFGTPDGPYTAIEIFDPGFGLHDSWTWYDADHTPWEAKYSRHFAVELLGYLDIDTSNVCPANTTFELYMHVIDGPDGDEVINMNVVVETAQNATVRIGFDDATTY
jgi:hypothetical protein